MRIPLGGRISDSGVESPNLWQLIRLRYVAMFLLSVLFLLVGQAQTQQAAKPGGAEPVPEAAIPAILAAFDKYEVVAMPHGHGLQDLDNLILTLIRTPVFSEKVNDIEFECGNSLYQPVLDRYIAGEAVQFTEVQKVWRKIGVVSCGGQVSSSNFSRWCGY